MIQLALTATLVFLASTFCSLAEACLVAISPFESKKLERTHPKIAKHIISICQNKHEYLSTIMMLNTAVNIGGSLFVGSLAVQFFTSHHYIIFTIVFTTLMLLLSELKPKIFAATHPATALKFIQRPLRFISFFARPLAKAVNCMLNLSTHKRSEVSAEEIEHFIESASEIGLLKDHEAGYINSAFELRNKCVTDVITTSEIHTLPIAESIETHTDLICSTKHTKILLANTEGKPIGFFYTCEALASIIQHKNCNFSDIVHPITTLNKNTTLSDAADKLISQEHKIAAVVDTNGSLCGVITLNDIQEVIFS
ncbi:CNNM domain-containing protein [Vibrio breoganii]